MATHSSILAWRIPRTEESGRLQVLGVTRVGHDLATKPNQKNKMTLKNNFEKLLEKRRKKIKNKERKMAKKILISR